jgi:hypothetical protein
MTAPTKQGQNPQPCIYKDFPKVAGRNIHFAKVLFLVPADRVLLAYLSVFFTGVTAISPSGPEPIKRASCTKHSPEFINTMPIAIESCRFPLDEEIAGPITTASPTIISNRISSIDVLRGVALLGILVMNIDLFGNPEIVHDIPVGLPLDAFTGPH